MPNIIKGRGKRLREGRGRRTLPYLGREKKMRGDWGYQTHERGLEGVEKRSAVLQRWVNYNEEALNWARKPRGNGW